MALQFVHKRFPNRLSVKIVSDSEPKVSEQSAVQIKAARPTKNKKEKTVNSMNTKDKIAAAEAAVENIAQEVKIVKKDRGLIERTESSKIILTEDNRQVLND